MSRLVISDMSKLVISDLSFCESELPEQEKIRGTKQTPKSFFAVKFDFAIASLFDPSGDAAAGFAAGIGLAIGDKINITIGTGSISGK
ncbi:MAG: hypothetical protein ACRDEA_13430 [Microcystaceae cyanobacterium]